jgi:hypothetical protein
VGIVSPEASLTIIPAEYVAEIQTHDLLVVI